MKSNWKNGWCCLKLLTDIVIRSKINLEKCWSKIYAAPITIWCGLYWSHRELWSLQYDAIYTEDVRNWHWFQVRNTNLLTFPYQEQKQQLGKNKRIFQISRPKYVVGTPKLCEKHKNMLNIVIFFTPILA